MNVNYETKFESDSEDSEDYVESIVTTSGKTSESLLSAPTLYSDSDVSVKVYNFTAPPSKFVCLFSNMGYKFVIKRKYTRPSNYLSVCLSRSNTIYLPFETEYISIYYKCNYNDNVLDFFLSFNRIINGRNDKSQK
nr:uncharacterized protein LOC106686507 isoform X2 [Halyomorpha halys]